MLHEFPRVADPWWPNVWVIYPIKPWNLAMLVAFTLDSHGAKCSLQEEMQKIHMRWSDNTCSNKALWSWQSSSKSVKNRTEARKNLEDHCSHSSPLLANSDNAEQNHTVIGTFADNMVFLALASYFLALHWKAIISQFSVVDLLGSVLDISNIFGTTAKRGHIPTPKFRLVSQSRE